MIKLKDLEVLEILNNNDDVKGSARFNTTNYLAFDLPEEGKIKNTCKPIIRYNFEVVFIDGTPQFIPKPRCIPSVTSW
ncbi:MULTISPECIES: hypothetical protein [unclassified Moorena]|uniref:hypothetical protein n=1 Tax=unclassified Moorena TaxID=2683338 RepID=UPI0013FFE12D|nr:MULTISPECIES: hypothetical protein [unclassified Moorena]NEO16559.1 hypothetical protein [Moorena sp. SIO3E8]NEQ03089.1 hypothetical protein [Moorena sp. SIO3F7]